LVEERKPEEDPEKPVARPSAGDAATVTPPSAGTGGSASPKAELEETLISATPSTAFSVAIQDLTHDKLLISAPRIVFENRTVPALGNIPLLARLGQGGMGAVYFGFKTLLKKEVAVKVLPMHLAQSQPQLVQRFLREAQIAAKIESPHLVLVTDVSEDGGLFYLVMEYVHGKTAGAHLRAVRNSGAQGLDEASALDICIAATTGLAAAHASGVIHRDVKPENIMIPKRRGHGTEDLIFSAAKLADLGLARADDVSGPSLTGAKATMGTPGYLAPEQALNARQAGKPADVFSMGATLYALLEGNAPFKGETATESILATIQKVHTPILHLRSDVSPATADLIERCLNKDPARRYADASALQRALTICRSSLGGAPEVQAEALNKIADLQSAVETGQHLAVKETTPAKPAEPGPAPAATGAPPLPASSTPTPTPATHATTIAMRSPATARLTLFAAALAIFAVAGAGWFAISSNSAREREGRYAAAIIDGEKALSAKNWTQAEAAFKRALTEKPDDGTALKGLVAAQSGTLGGSDAIPAEVKIGIAFSPEKIDWVRLAIDQFAQTPAGKGVNIEVLTMNAPEGMNAVLSNDKRIMLWSPASNLYRDLFVQEWKATHNGTDPIGREQLLSLTPMVFVMFEERYQEFVKKYGALNFETLSKALQVPDGWKGIAQKPEWGRFMFALGDPHKYNSALAALTLMAFSFYKKETGLTHQDIEKPEFARWVSSFGAAMVDRGSSAQNMTDMVLRGATAWDGIFTYESEAVQNSKNVEGRWGAVRIVYPELNIWNDNPCFLINAEWVTPAQKKAANTFLDFLVSEPIQKLLIDQGFRPANHKVPILFPDSPFRALEKFGLKINVDIAVDPPGPEVLKALMALAKSEEK
jgi:serine/threonine protein kinase/ABC-type Fe3+ transport system substrate-binding protein